MQQKQARLMSNFEGIEAPQQHILYDLSIEDLEERKAKARTFDCVKDISIYTGVKVETIFKKRTSGTKLKSTMLNKTFAVRVKKPN